MTTNTSDQAPAAEQQASLTLSSSDDELNLPQRASISTLPTEIQARIVRMVHLQDVAYKKRKSEATGATAKILDRLDERNYGQSLHALACVNKTFNLLAAVHLFSIVDASCTSESVFRHRLLVKGRDTFKHLVLSENASDEDLDTTLSYLPQLSRISELTLSVSALEGMFDSTNLDEHEQFDTDELHRYHSFVKLATGIRSLKLEPDCGSLDGRRLTSLIRPFVNLVELTMSFEGNTEASEELGALLASMLHLDKLNITIGSGGDEIPSSWNTLSWKTANTLRSLSLVVTSMSQTTYLFINTFKNLRRLSLKFDNTVRAGSERGPEDQRLNVDATCTSLPALQSLAIEGDHESVVFVVRCLIRDDASIPMLNIVLRGPSLARDASDYTELFDRFHDLQSCSIVFSDGSRIKTPTFKINLENYCRKRNIFLDLSTLWDPLVTGMQKTPSPHRYRQYVQKRCNAAEQVMRKGQLLVDRARMNDDVVGIDEMLEALQTLKVQVQRSVD